LSDIAVTDKKIAVYIDLLFFFVYNYRKEKPFMEEYMKKTVRIILAAMLAAILALSMSCAGGNGNGTDTQSAPADPGADGTGESSIVGVWKLPKEEWINKEKAEVWVFDADGSTFYYYQLTNDNAIADTIDGSYVLEGDQLTVTMAGWTLPAYTIAFKDADTMTRADHDTEVTLTRFKDELKK